MPAISVIVPVYNMSSSLTRSVDSLLNQSFADFEAILVDDGSSDGSGAVCDAYAAKDARIKVIHKANGGVGAARNDALAVASGTWVTFVDADDIVMPNWLATFSRGFDSGADLIVQGYVRVETDGTRTVSEGKELLCGRSEAALTLIEDPLKGVVWNKAFRLKLLKEAGVLYDPTVRPGQDDLFTSEYLPHIDNACFVKGAEYVYHVPDWNAKYSRDWAVMFPVKAKIYSLYRRSAGAWDERMKASLGELCWLFHGTMKKRELASLEKLSLFRDTVCDDMERLPIAKDVVFVLRHVHWDTLLFYFLRVRSHVKFYHFLQIRK